ncbi:phosphoglycolate phosphatase [Breznakia sp. PF5-3]|uniref:HAD-IA family hydrolase n=1 Tax=unclassified Breznakia TaxID=2623764 RepID=UPI002405614B|nr:MULTISPECIES: HAD-IA family hydrolase [unclassified Breznakia]MDF9825894.1 phosphoglycolate phosphatase [Breznakia sp. PM6-1]MDF9836691.1 phosphoglycolate phosphatase [Breznakia sp. PF5-3]MDF9838965.1 phosphoglycolate phosphatase [Breznakia sp. PFB2-8]MDF9860985.1 phosphoglycolate phosphatase [Breznakia sp. PH5-24]
MYKAIVFDCDGTLVNSSVMIELIYHGYHKLYPKREKLPYEHFIQCYFSTADEIHQYLHIEDKNKAKFHQYCFGEHEKTLKNVKAFDGISETIHILKKHGYILGVNTSRRRDGWEEVESQIGNSTFLQFEYIITSDILKHPKPNPESLYTFCDITKITMNNVLYIGDSKVDADCAAAANCDFALANWGVVQNLDLPAKYILDTPYDVLKILNIK